ncbi:MAG: ribosome biogenesis GTP-binding protein YihA/YsxC [Liquorilactobacillus ghanensis]|uniref:ribosome biogenesis GTP-binding protein YihA/YsxC n=1 Tax=Liquorilactobacillus ghanensis TaxID=399370 RepID=UPI0039E7A54D
MKTHQIELQISAVGPAQYPGDQLPEIALVGRSNVGKSSLVNSLVGRKGFARTSNQPGKTQTLNFYTIDQKWRLIDVPGYGYAKVSKKQRADWGKMIENYLTQRENLRGVISLIDGRHQPMELDKQMVEFLRYYQLPVLVVATKTDKVPRNRRNKINSVFKQQLQIAKNEELILYSTVERYGQAEVWNWLNQQLN